MKLPFDDATIQRYSRQILLREIGGAGQRKLLSAHVQASGIAAEYLRRAGVRVSEIPEQPRSVIDKWLSGSMAAVEELKRILR
jgi:molybdopterin/thiamine biosynthesis adenylyltransferase